MADDFTSNLSPRIALTIMMHGAIHEMSRALEELEALRGRCFALSELAPVWATLDALTTTPPARRCPQRSGGPEQHVATGSEAVKRLRVDEKTRLEVAAAPPRVPSRSELEAQVTELVAQQAAISEVLRSIAGSEHDLVPIFETMLAKAKRLCRAKSGALYLLERDALRVVARIGPPNPYLDACNGLVLAPPGTPLARLIESRAPVHIADLASDPAYRRRDPYIVALVEAVGGRTLLLLPLLKEDELVGAIGILREQAEPFTESQIKLLTDFAVQATIALESTRRERQYHGVQIELAHTNRVATIGQLAASIAHELKQPIAAARISAGAGLRFFDKNPPALAEVREALACIVNDTDRAGDVVDRINALFKKTPPRKEALDVNTAILQVAMLTHSEAINNGVTVRTQLADHLPHLEGDRVQLQQVMLNLIVNAIQAMSDVAADRRDLLISSEATKDGVHVGVRDTGPGLSPESLPRLFEPFYTTKPEGMGMGLSICRSIIEAHGGRMWATGCEPQGALFQFTLPSS